MIQVVRSSFFFALMTGAFGASILTAQCPPPTWSSANHQPGLGGEARAIISWDPDGAGPAPPVLVVGGSFAIAGGTAVSQVATWDGVAWHPLGTPLGAVTALAVYNGDLIASGAYATAQGANGFVAKWNGTSWQLLGTGMVGPGTPLTGIFASVEALAVYNGELIAGGSFITAGGIPAQRIARWNGSVWQSLGSGVTASFGSPIVSALAVYNGELIAAGDFATAGGTAATNIARWNGASWQSVGGGVSYGSGYNVRALAVYGTELIAGGVFDQAGSTAMVNNNIARWNGTSWQPMGTGITSGSVRALAVYGADLVAGGSFHFNGGVPNYVTRWNGSAWQMVGPGGGTFDDTVRALGVFNSALIAGGAFTAAGGGNAKGVARWDGTGWYQMDTGINRSVLAFTEYAGLPVAGGWFTTADDIMPRCDVAGWYGSSWQRFGPGMNHYVAALAVWNGELFAGGGFQNSGGSAQTGGTDLAKIGRWDGVQWQPLGSGMNGDVVAMTVYNGELIAAGPFSVAGGASCNRIAKWNGTFWSSVGTGITNFSVLALTTYAGSLVAAGVYSFGLTPTYTVALWNGSSWQPLGGAFTGLAHPVEPIGVRALTVYNGDLIAGGWFNDAGGTPVNNIARWNGATWQPLGGGVNEAVYALTTLPGKLVAGGNFSNYIRYWDGASWQTPGTGVDKRVVALTNVGGSLFAGGDFSFAGGVVSPYVARWSSPLPVLTFSQQGGPGVGVTIANHGLIPGHEYYNVGSLDLAPGGPGTGPYGGLWFNDPAFLFGLLALPVGTEPIHFIATASDVSFAPYWLPSGISFEALCGDVTGGVIGCLSVVVPYTVY